MAGGFSYHVLCCHLLSTLHFFFLYSCQDMTGWENWWMLKPLTGSHCNMLFKLLTHLVCIEVGFSWPHYFFQSDRMWRSLFLFLPQVQPTGSLDFLVSLWCARLEFSAEISSSDWERVSRFFSALPALGSRQYIWLLSLCHDSWSEHIPLYFTTV